MKGIYSRYTMLLYGRFLSVGVGVGVSMGSRGVGGYRGS
jgi:hypothetical protein